MYKKRSISLAVTGVLLFLLGGIIGAVYGAQKESPQVKTKITSSLASKVITSVVAYGQVSRIEGKTLVLSNMGNSLPIFISNNAKIYSLVASSGVKTPVQKAASFGDIKLNSHVNVNLESTSDGQFQGSSVVILP